MINNFEKQYAYSEIMAVSQNLIEDKSPDNVVALLDKLIKYSVIEDALHIVSSNFSTASKFIEILVETNKGYEFILVSGIMFNRGIITNVMAERIKRNHMYEINHRPDNIIKDIVCRYVTGYELTEDELTELIDAMRKFVFKDKNERFVSSNISNYSQSNSDYLAVTTNKHTYKLYSDGFSLKVKICSSRKVLYGGFNTIRNCPKGEYLISDDLKKTITTFLIKIGYLPSNSLRVLSSIIATVVNDGNTRNIKVVRNGVTITIPLEAIEHIAL